MCEKDEIKFSSCLGDTGNFKGTVSVISSYPPVHAKISMLCLIKHKSDINIFDLETVYFDLWALSTSDWPISYIEERLEKFTEINIFRVKSRFQGVLL